MNEREIAQVIGDALLMAERNDEDGDLEGLVGVELDEFKSAGILTRDAGLVIRLKDGSEFQITVVRSR